MPTPLYTDPVVLNLWRPLAAIAETAPGRDHTTTLLEEQIAYALTTTPPYDAGPTGSTRRLH